MDFKSGQFENTCVINDTEIFGSRILVILLHLVSSYKNVSVHQFKEKVINIQSTLVPVVFRNSFLGLTNLYMYAHDYTHKIVGSLSNENENTPAHLLRSFHCSPPGLKFAMMTTLLHVSYINMSSQPGGGMWSGSGLEIRLHNYIYTV